MRELSLNILDIAQNSVSAGSTRIGIDVLESSEAHTLTIRISDNGCGMSEATVKRVQDPFYTTRTTRKVGMGIPLFKMAAEMTGGSFSIDSAVGKGTTTRAVFRLRSIDRMPLGDISGVIHTLVTFHPDMDFLYRYGYNDKSFTMDTRQFREILQGVPLNAPDVSDYIAEYLKENKNETDGGVEI